jgi:hypothetical protein
MGILTTNSLAEGAAMLNYIKEVLGSNRGLETSCPNCRLSWVSSVSPDAGIVLQIRQRSFPSTSFPSHYSLIMPQFDTM